MAELNAELAADVLAACEAGKQEIADALGRALDAEFELSFGESASYDAQSPPDGCDGAGLAVLMLIDGQAAAFVMPESTGLLPDWYRAPDPTGVSKLMTLAQELGMLMIPESLMASDFKAAAVEGIAAALTRGDTAADAATIPVTLKAGDKSGTAHLVWPLANPDAALHDAKAEAAAEASTAKEGEPAPAASSSDASSTAAVPRPTVSDFDNLPPYARSLLKIRVPVTVTLARKKQPVARILELSPGSILQFEKSCDEMLELEIGNLPIAQGEAVKVGDRFGLRITQLQLPEERFLPFRKP